MQDNGIIMRIKQRKETMDTSMPLAGWDTYDIGAHAQNVMYYNGKRLPIPIQELLTSLSPGTTYKYGQAIWSEKDKAYLKLTWKNIQKMVDEGTVQNYFKVGDCLQIPLLNPVNSMPIDSTSSDATTFNLWVIGINTYNGQFLRTQGSNTNHTGRCHIDFCGGSWLSLLKNNTIWGTDGRLIPNPYNGNTVKEKGIFHTKYNCGLNDGTNDENGKTSFINLSDIQACNVTKEQPISENDTTNLHIQCFEKIASALGFYTEAELNNGRRTFGDVEINLFSSELANADNTSSYPAYQTFPAPKVCTLEQRLPPTVDNDGFFPLWAGGITDGYSNYVFGNGMIWPATKQFTPTSTYSSPVYDLEAEEDGSLRAIPRWRHIRGTALGDISGYNANQGHANPNSLDLPGLLLQDLQHFGTVLNEEDLSTEALMKEKFAFLYGGESQVGGSNPQDHYYYQCFALENTTSDGDWTPEEDIENFGGRWVLRSGWIGALTTVLAQYILANSVDKGFDPDEVSTQTKTAAKTHIDSSDLLTLKLWTGGANGSSPLKKISKYIKAMEEELNLPFDSAQALAVLRVAGFGAEILGGQVANDEDEDENEYPGVPAINWANAILVSTSQSSTPPAAIAFPCGEYVESEQAYGAVSFNAAKIYTNASYSGRAAFYPYLGYSGLVFIPTFQQTQNGGNTFLPIDDTPIQILAQQFYKAKNTNWFEKIKDPISQLKLAIEQRSSTDSGQYYNFSKTFNGLPSITNQDMLDRNLAGTMLFSPSCAIEFDSFLTNFFDIIEKYFKVTNGGHPKISSSAKRQLMQFWPLTETELFGNSIYGNPRFAGEGGFQYPLFQTIKGRRNLFKDISQSYVGTATPVANSSTDCVAMDLSSSSTEAAIGEGGNKAIDMPICFRIEAQNNSQ